MSITTLDDVYALIKEKATEEEFIKVKNILEENLNVLQNKINDINNSVSSIKNDISTIKKSIDQTKVKVKIITKSNIDIATKSASGTYYADIGTVSSLGISGTIVGVTIGGWTHALSMFSVYVEGNTIGVMSSVVQTVGNIQFIISYI